MSQICEKCGSVIPENADVCPNCGAYTDSVLQSVLDEFEQEAEETAPEEPVPETSEEDPERTKVFDGAAVEEEAKRQSGAAPRANSDRRPRRKPAKKTGKKRKKRKKKAEEWEDPMKKRNAAIIGVLIGLAVSLLLIAAAAAFLMSKMGFFAPMSDEELLGTPVVQQTAPTPTPTPAAPAEEPEESPEPSQEVTEAPTPTPLQVDSFELTGDYYAYLYSRGETFQVEYAIAPESAAKQIQWSSSSEIIADVDETGLITARRGGECVITGTCGDKEISFYVYCDFEVPTTVLDMNMEDITMTYEGQTVTLKIDYDLSEDFEESIVWESSDPTVAKVDDEGVVTALANGTTIITASISDYTASCIVRCVDVTGNKGYNSTESEYVINFEDVTLTRKGEYFQLELTSILNNKVPSFTWESDDPEVATVDKKGVVTAVADGVANITATVGQDQFRCIVRVNIE